MVRLKNQTNLVKRKPSGIYYFRARVPKELVTLLGKTEILDSLNTKDVREATALASARRNEIQQALAKVRARTAAPVQPLRRVFLSDDDIQQICQSYRAEWLESDERMRRSGMSEVDSEQYSEIIAAWHPVVVKAAARGDIAFIEDTLRGHLHKLKIDVDESSEAYKRLAYAMLTTEAELNHARMARDAGHAVVTPKVRQDGLSLDRIVEYWASHTSALPRTRAAVQSVFDELGQLHPGMLARAFRKTHLVEFRDELQNQGLSPRTVYKKLGFIHAAFAVALESDLVEVNPVAGVKPPKDRRTEKPRIPFTADDLNALFSTPVHLANLRPVGGGGEAAFWLPLLGLFTGARLEELAQLRPCDLVHAEGLGHYLNITDEGEGAHLKTRSARRRVPIHAELNRCGFLTYCELRGSAGDDFLFPDLKPDVTGKRSGNWSKWFSRFKREAGIVDRRRVFHSFRHGFIDACRAAGIQAEVRDVLVGHANGSVAAQYGEGNYPLQPLFDAVERVKFEGVNLHHLQGRRQGIL